MDSIAEEFDRAINTIPEPQGDKTVTPNQWARSVVFALEAHARVVSKSLARLEGPTEKGYQAALGKIALLEEENLRLQNELKIASNPFPLKP